MTPIKMNALLPGLLLTACFSVFADEPITQSSFSSEGGGSATYTTLSGPVVEEVDAADVNGGNVEVLGRTSADSMHSGANANAQVADDYKVNKVSNTGE